MCVTWTVDFVAEVMDDEGYVSTVSIVLGLEDILFHILSNLSTKDLTRVARSVAIAKLVGVGMSQKFYGAI